jgi:hypothetical protein
MFCHLESGSEDITATFRAGGRRMGQLLLALRFSGDGQVVKSVKVIQSATDWFDLGGEPPTLRLAPDDELWMTENDVIPPPYGKPFGYSPPSMWHRIWVWDEGGAKGAPLIDLSHGPNRFLNLPLEGAGPPLIARDGKGRIYAMLARSDTSGQDRIIRIEGKVWHVAPMDFEGQKALVVFDKRQHAVFSLPWAPVSYEIGRNWVSPVPDGSGFYRIAFGGDSAEIYFYATD